MNDTHRPSESRLDTPLLRSHTTRIMVVTALVICGILSGCARSMARYDSSLHNVVKNATPESIQEHIELLESMIREAETDGEKPRPGTYAELGYLTALQGDKDRGFILLQMEENSYPESARFVAVMKRMVGDENAGGNDATPRTHKNPDHKKPEVEDKGP